MNQVNSKRDVRFVGSAKKDLAKLPATVAAKMAEALDVIAEGASPATVAGIKAKPLKDIGGGSVMELISRYDSNTYRSMYTIKIGNCVYVLHCFMKKSKSGIGLPRPDRNVIESRLKQAKEIAKNEA